MGILDDIKNHEVWQAFVNERSAANRFTRADERFFRELVAERGYRAVTDRALESDFSLSVPEKRLINKQGGKKRVIYTFSDVENAALKLIAFLLYRYDAALPDNLYSFRRDRGAKQAVRRLCATPGIGEMFCYKLDIKDYFNSIPAELLLPMLKELLRDDAPLYEFFRRTLERDEAVFAGELISEKRGVMAGTPTSPFLANLFLTPLDRHFEEKGVPYARYSDDIIVFAKSQSELDGHKRYIAETLSRNGLSVNPDKETNALPGEPWTFLGVRYHAGVIDLAPSTVYKLKGKIRRKARALFRWKERNGADGKRTMKAFARSMNRKLFEEQDDADRFTWSRWFFPLVTSADGFKEIDEYMRQYMRYAATGRFNKANYRIRHGELKECGLRSLVGEYYKYVEKLRENNKPSQKKEGR